MNNNHKILHLDSNISIYLNIANDWIYADWTGDQTKETVMRGCESILQFMTAEGCSKILNDNTHVSSNWIDAAEWVAMDWFPRMDEAGLRYFAWVYSPNTFSRISADETISFKSTQSITITFDDIETAKSWLRSV